MADFGIDIGTPRIETESMGVRFPEFAVSNDFWQKTICIATAGWVQNFSTESEDSKL